MLTPLSIVFQTNKQHKEQGVGLVTWSFKDNSREFAFQIPTAWFSEKSRERLVKGVKKTKACGV